MYLLWEGASADYQRGPWNRKAQKPLFRINSEELGTRSHKWLREGVPGSRYHFLMMPGGDWWPEYRNQRCKFFFVCSSWWHPVLPRQLPLWISARPCAGSVSPGAHACEWQWARLALGPILTSFWGMARVLSSAPKWCMLAWHETPS